MLRLGLGFKLVYVKVIVRATFKLGFRIRVTVEDKVWVSNRFRVSIRIWL